MFKSNGYRPSHVLFLGFWGLHDPLTTSSFLPTIEWFTRRYPGLRMTLATVERGEAPSPQGVLPVGVGHVTLRASRFPVTAIARALDMLLMPFQLVLLAQRQGVGLMVARSTLAGGLGYFVNRLTGIPYVVESVEPHTEYMVECGAWSRRGLFATVGQWLERRVLSSAQGIITVSQRYATRLVDEGYRSDRIRTVPCPVRFDRFAYEAGSRAAARERLGWMGDEIVGVYLGKFGGLYHDEQAYRAFSVFLREMGQQGRLLIASPELPSNVLRGLDRHGVDPSLVYVAHVPHDEVPSLLHAADVAFALYKGTRSSAYLSPIKNGEYWASGLPVLMTRGVGDDSDLIAGDAFGGALFDPDGNDLPDAIRSIREVLSEPDQRLRTMALARRARGEEHMTEAYTSILASLPAPFDRNYSDGSQST